MNRPLALLGALLAASLAVSSACLAQASDAIHFTLERQRSNPAKIHASFHRQGRGDNDNSWSTGFMPSELIGLEVSSFHAAGTRPVHFAIAREAGRLDCAGSGGSDFAAGSCRFAADPGFTQLLVKTGIGQPTYDQSFGLMAVNARRDLIQALPAAHYPTPRINDLMALAALGVDGRYITEMSRAGYRPQTLQKLVEFKALGITPQWIGGFVRAGYANVPGDGLVQMRALGITPEYIQGFQRIGYRNLPVNTLVQLKALDITPEFVRSVAGAGQPMPPVNKLVELRTFANRR
jgi:hypothetical protein